MPDLLEDNSVEHVDLDIAPQVPEGVAYGDPEEDAPAIVPSRGGSIRNGETQVDDPTDTIDRSAELAKDLGEWEDETEAEENETEPSAEQPAEEEAAADGAETEQSEPQHEASEHSQQLRQWAAYLGMNRDDFASEAAFERNVIQAAKLVAPANQGEQQAGNNPAEQQPAEESEPVDVWEGIDKDSLDPDVVKVLDRLSGQAEAKYQQRIDALEKSLSEVQPAVSFYQKSFVEQQEREFDSAFKAMNDKFGGIFGDKPGRELGEKSPEHSARISVLEQAVILAGGYQAQGRSVPDQATLLEHASRIVHANHLETLAGKKAVDSVTKRAKQAVAAPTAREGRPLSERERVIQGIGNRLRELGVSEADEDFDDGI